MAELSIPVPVAQNEEPSRTRKLGKARRRGARRTPKRMTGPRSIDLHHVRVPLKKPIKHASFERADSDNLVVRVTLADGTQGFGEGVPRSYVTGETIDSA